MDEVFMLTKKTKIIIFSLLILLGIFLLVYGSTFHTISVLKGPATDKMPIFTDPVAKKESMLVLPETAVVKDVTMEGVVHWPSGDIQRRYTIDKSGNKVDATGKKLPEACPT